MLVGLSWLANYNIGWIVAALGVLVLRPNKYKMYVVLFWCMITA